MKPINIIVILIAAIFLWSCALKTGLVKVDPEDQLFYKAEKKFQTESYEEALETFNEYLFRFPDRPLASAALMKVGDIHKALGNHTKARNVYERLIAEYPDSVFVADAKINIIVTFYNQGEYSEVIDQAAIFLKRAVSMANIIKTYVLLGDTYLAMGSSTDAVNYYAIAYSKSEDPEKKIVLGKLIEAIQKLGSEEIVFLLKRLEDMIPTGCLMYQLGIKNAEEDKYDEALKVLSVFIEKFPEHENVQHAKSLIAEINKKSIYSRYTVGCLFPLSGFYKIYGNRALKGVELALSQFSSQNATPSIKLIIKDTGSDPVKTVLAAKELFDENIAAIIGPIITAESAAMEAQDRGIPIITITQKENITDIGDYVFRNFFTPKMQVKALVSYAIDKLELNTFAILYPDENYGKTFMNLFWDEVIANGGKVVGVESYDSANTDFADPIKKLVGLYYEVPEDLREPVEPIPDEESKDTENNKDKKNEVDEEPKAIVDFDAIFIPDAPKKAGLIIPQLAFYDASDTHLLGTNLWHSPSLIDMARQYVQGAIMTDGFFAESSSKHVRDFVKIFQETFNEKPGFIEAVAYDTAMILFQTVSRPDIRFRGVLKNRLKELTDFRGATGSTIFDENGDVLKELYLIRVEGSRFVELEYY
jgi:ABC-type branched-subunit amino acid transport system substrate-binding protein/predicted negative regulator of RcsB-dependent stress response